MLTASGGLLNAWKEGKKYLHERGEPSAPRDRHKLGDVCSRAQGRNMTTVELLYLVLFTCILGDSYRRRFKSFVFVSHVMRVTADDRC